MTEQSTASSTQQELLPRDIPLTTSPRAEETAAQRKRRLRKVQINGLHVSEADIDSAIKENSHSCMIAEAIKRQVPGISGVVVDVQSIRWTDVKRRVRVICLTPRECQANLVRFDRGIPPLPFSFNLQSSQVTPVRGVAKRVDADGRPVMREEVQRKVLKDGSVTEYRYNRQARRRTGSHGPKVLTNTSVAAAPSRDHITGGAPPPVDKRSFRRGFGVRAFTWEAGEDEAEIVRRHAAYLGIKPSD